MYALVEGEALALAWALHKTHHLTRSNEKVTFLVDHKPFLFSSILD